MPHNTLFIDNAPRELIPIGVYRHTHHLPADFGVAYFEPKNYTGLGQITPVAHTALETLIPDLLAAIPPTIAPQTMFDTVRAVAHVFRLGLQRINPTVGLRPFEIDFAIVGLEDALQQASYELIRLAHTPGITRATLSTAFDPVAHYQSWLNGTVRLSATAYPYTHLGQTYTAHVINTAYGRVGLRLTTPSGDIHYLADPGLACPAAAYMHHLITTLTPALANAVAHTLPT